MQTKTKDKSLFQVVPKKNRELAQKMLENSSFYDVSKKDNICDFRKDRLLQYKDVLALQPIIDIIYPPGKFCPTQLSTSNDELIELGTLVSYLPRNHVPSKKMLILAYVMKAYRNKYNIFINEDCEDAAFDSMDLHEKGHILFNHTQGVKLSIEQFKKELDLVWDTLTKWFEKDALKNKDKIVKMLYHEFSNIAQDMEINSKLFDNGEWIKSKKVMARSGMIVHYKYLLSKFDDLSGLLKDDKDRKIDSKSYLNIVNTFEILVKNVQTRINGEEGDFKFCYPANKGWPEKLDWMTYMILLVKDIDETMQQVVKNLQESGMPMPGNDDSSGGKKISSEVLNEYSEKCDSDDMASEDNNNKNGEAEETDDGNGEDDFGDADDAQSKRSAGGNGRSENGHAKNRLEFETCDSFESFTKYLAKHCLGKKNRRLNSDVLYNSNRGKFASKVVVPRRHYIDKWVPTEIVVLIDVSGSVPTDYVERVINAIIDNNSGIDLKNSHIIFCDTRVVSDEIISKRTKSVYAGGGTAMKNGLKYIQEKGYNKKSSSKLFVISDMEDDMKSWLDAVKKIPGVHYAIGYNVGTKKDLDNNISRGDFGKGQFASEWNKYWKTVFITDEIQ